MTTKSSRCSQQITMGFNLPCLREHLFQKRHHDRLQFRTNTTTIKINRRHLIRIQIRKQFLVQNPYDNTPLLVEGIDALGMEMRQGA